MWPRAWLSWRLLGATPFCRLCFSFPIDDALPLLVWATLYLHRGSHSLVHSISSRSCLYRISSLYILHVSALGAHRRAHTTPCVSWRSARRATPLTLWGELRSRDMVVPLSSLAFTCRGDKATKKCSKRRGCDAPTACAWQKQVGVSHKPTAGLLCRASCRRRSENRQNGRRRRRTERAQSLRRSCSVPTYRTSRHT